MLTLIAYNFSVVRSHLCASRTTLVAPFPIAIFWQTPYFLVKLRVLSPALLFPIPLFPASLPASESECLDDRDVLER